MPIDCTIVSDLHGFFPTLPGGDLLILAGDYTARDEDYEWHQFSYWLEKQHYRKKILIAGNHDNHITDYVEWDKIDNVEYLCDSGTGFEGLKIWGSPWTKTFEGMNPHCKAFTVDTEEELEKRFELIPDDTDILICHSPVIYKQDRTQKGEHVGSTSLHNWVYMHKEMLTMFVCGHVHEGYGICDTRIKNDPLDSRIQPIFVNASHVNEHYEPVNEPIRVIL